MRPLLGRLTRRMDESSGPLAGPLRSASGLLMGAQVNDKIYGTFIFFPTPFGKSEDYFLRRVRPEKDIEGLTVENTGEQLAPQTVVTLAEPFLRGTTRLHTDHAGAGLGLAIVKSITHAHDGTLTLSPRPDGGLHVTVQLPAAP